jgi:hypothetical protein
VFPDDNISERKEVHFPRIKFHSISRIIINKLMKALKMSFPDDLQIPNIHLPPPPPPSVNQASYAPAAKCGLRCMAQTNTCTRTRTRTHNEFELCCYRADALAFIPMQHSLSILILNFKSFERKLLPTLPHIS